MNISFTPQQILVALLIMIGIILIANIVDIVIMHGLDHGYGQIYGFFRLFNVDDEQSISTFFSALQLFVAALILWLISVKNKSLGLKYIYWRALAAIFLFLTIDEFSSIHERPALVEPLRANFELSGLLYHPWVIPYGIAAFLVAILFSRFVLSLPKVTARRFIVAGAMYVTGAIGFEMLGGRQAELFGLQDFTYTLYYTCEELLEMLGIAYFLYALFSYLAAEFKALTIAVNE